MTQLSEESSRARGAAVDSGLTVNECRECDGEGEVLCGDGSNNPDQHTYLDECEACCGTGNAECPNCGNPAAYLVHGDGRCVECPLQADLELVESAVHTSGRVATLVPCRLVLVQNADAKAAVEQGYDVLRGPGEPKGSA